MNKSKRLIGLIEGSTGKLNGVLAVAGVWK
jgi:hypothetical protein